jgi:hypothetical protein
VAQSKIENRKSKTARPPGAATGLGYITNTLTALSPAEAALRPLSFADFSGQPKTVERLQVMVGAAAPRRGAQPHSALRPARTRQDHAGVHPRPGDRQNVRVTSGPVVEKAGDLAGLLTNLEEGDMLFIDEIHRIPKTVEEYLYSAMEDFRLDIMIDQGPNARSVRLTIPRFTSVGATTRSGLLTAPLRSRFTLQTRLDYYDHATLEGDRAPQLRPAQSGDRRRRRAGDRQTLPRHAAHRQQSHQLRPRLRALNGQGQHHAARRRRRRSSSSRSTPPVSTRWTSACCA